MTLEDYAGEKQSENELVEQIARKIVTQMQVPEFGIGAVPTSVAARVMGKSEAYVISGLEQGWLPFGACPKNSSKRNPYISPKLFWEYTGYVWKGGEE